MTTTTYFDNERIERAVLTALQSDFQTHLDTVAARWASVDPLDLPSVVTWGEPGYDPSAIDKPSSYYPYVEVVAPDRNPSESPGARTDQWARKECTVSLVVSYIVVEEDVATLNKINKRYAEAMDLFLSANPRFEAAERRNYKQDGKRSPEISLLTASRHRKNPVQGRQGGNLQREVYVDWMAGGTLELVLHG